MENRFMYEGICVVVPSNEDKYIEKVRKYVDTKQYVVDLQQYCKVEEANILQIRIDENERISLSYQSGNECGGFTTFLVSLKECDNNED